MKVNDLKKGAITVMWYGALIFTFFDFQTLEIFNIFSVEFALNDIFISSIVGVFQGAAIGWSLGKFG